jgi:choloylglycine hydrolase
MPTRLPALRAVAALALAAAALLATLPAPASACTTFRLRTKDGGWVVGRSMEFGQALESQVMVVPRGFTLSSTRPDLKPGMAWTTKYGFVGMNALGVDLAVDGMNEAGLSVAALYFPGFAGYPPFPADGKDAVANLEFVNWALSRFATVGEVKEALAKVVVYDLVIPQAGGSQPIHWAVRDAKGGSIVVEYVGGKLQVYENPVGVMTNSPSFDWHLTNLRNYVNLTALNVEPLRLGETVIQPLGQGTGLLGLPGDYTPPSRFVKAVALAWSAVQVATPAEAANVAFHILNAVDIPNGAVVEKAPGKGGVAPTLTYDVTEWATVHDLQGKVFYFRTYGNLNLRKVDLTKLDLAAKAIRHVPVSTAMEVADLSSQAR